MLKALKELWTHSSIMPQAVEELADMLANSAAVYRSAWGVCAGEAVADKVKASLTEHDRDVNKGERSIRRMLVEHLNINPAHDVSGALAVMNMAKDIERIGDYSRNIYGIASRLDRPGSELALFEDMKGIHQQLESYFPKLERAIRDSNENIAHEILENYQNSKKDLKALQKKLFQTEMPVREAVASALLTQCFVRINAHLGNTASGLVFPLENIDFVSRGLREEANEPVE